MPRDHPTRRPPGRLAGAAEPDGGPPGDAAESRSDAAGSRALVAGSRGDAAESRALVAGSRGDAAGSRALAAGSRGDAAGSRALVIIPTFDEAQTLPDAVAAVLAAAPAAHILVVDDASPDGTGEIADALAAADPRIAVLHRTGPRGLGRAYLDGFDWALAHDYDIVVEMDADGSHPADRIPALLAPFADDPGLGAVIGSRWVPAGEVADWSWHRRLLSRTANSYARRALRLPVRDLTAGFRAYRAAALASIPRDGVVSRGYCFQIDMTVRLADAGWRVAETPITFRDRRVGESKMSGAIVLEAMWRVTVWGVQRRVPGRRRARVLELPSRF